MNFLCAAIAFAFAAIASVAGRPTASSAAFLAGVGIHDVTGPVGGINFMGYAMPEQITQGIHTRLRSRAFVFANSSGDRRIVYCSVDVPMVSQNVKRRVVQLLQETYGTELYSQQNVMLSSTHTHAGPGGYHQYLLYAITSLGHNRNSAELMARGIYGSIVRAHASVVPSHLFLATGKLTGANRNRSPFSYLANPLEERQRYADDGDTDKTMTLVKVLDAQSSRERALINWFAVHCTSMNNSNRLVSADNKGYASYLMETEVNQNNRNYPLDYIPYTGEKSRMWRENGTFFVAAFSQSNEGDVSPNVDGAFCLNTGRPCNFETSTCVDSRGRNRNELCTARGPGWKQGDRESTRLIGLRQFLKAKELYRQANTTLSSAAVDYAHAWIDMSQTRVKLLDGSVVHTCKPARGYSFAAGTTDGPGAFDFSQGDNSTGNPFWNLVRGFIHVPSREQIQCHRPKPILINTGEAKLPYPWEPTIVDIQIFRLGNLLILGVPAEFTTMAGRRLRAAVRNVFVNNGAISGEEIQVVIAGLSNSYSGYVSTWEEYQVQRYEGASTIFGPHTLAAYVQEFTRLAQTMVPPTPSPDLPPPAHDKRQGPVDFSNKLIGLLPPVLLDTVPKPNHFGDIVVDVRERYHPNETVDATFFAGHPRNVASNPDLQLEHTFMSVEKYIGPPQITIMRLARQWMRENMGSQTRVLVTVVADVNPYLLRLNVLPAVRFRIQDAQRGQQEDRTITPLVTLLVSQQDSKEPLIIQESQRNQLPRNLQPFWQTIRDDGDWDTRFHWWKNVAGASPISFARLEWEIGLWPTREDGVMGTEMEGMQVSVEGTFRLHYYGAHKSVDGHIHSHQGVSSMFVVAEDVKVADMWSREPMDLFA